MDYDIPNALGSRTLYNHQSTGVLNSALLESWEHHLENIRRLVKIGKTYTNIAKTWKNIRKNRKTNNIEAMKKQTGLEDAFPSLLGEGFQILCQLCSLLPTSPVSAPCPFQLPALSEATHNICQNAR
jgi:hypothetical protein